MLRRLHVPKIFVGEVPLDAIQTRHAHNVLRLKDGTSVELFDNHGTTASGLLIYRAAGDAAVRIDQLQPAPSAASRRLMVASAIPKAQRADWMIEKLSELGVHEFVPLQTARSVVRPQRGKLERWTRLAIESAKQSRRTSVIQIREPATIEQALAACAEAGEMMVMLLSLSDDARPIASLENEITGVPGITLLVGPEGGWTHEELARFASAGARAVRLTQTVLRTETAAVAAAAIVATYQSAARPKGKNTDRHG